MHDLDRITFDPTVMGGKPCIGGMRVTVGMLLGLVATGRSEDEILKLYPYLQAEDIRQALAYAAWRTEEVDLPLEHSYRYEFVARLGVCSGTGRAHCSTLVRNRQSACRR